MLGKTEGKSRRGQQRMRWLDSIPNSMDMKLSKLGERVEDGGAWHPSVQGVAKSPSVLVTEDNNNVLTAPSIILYHFQYPSAYFVNNNYNGQSSSLFYEAESGNPSGFTLRE